MFFLRYILMYKDVKKASEVCREGIEWRKDPKNRFFLEVAVEEAEANRLDLEKKGLSITSFHPGQLNGGFLQVVRINHVDFSPMMEFWTEEQLMEFNLLQQEMAWRKCDEITRKTGKLVRLIMANDFRYIKMETQSKKSMQAMEKAMKISDTIYPYLNKRTVCCNVPWWFSWLVKMAQMFVSNEAMQKFKTCRGGSDITTCPFVSRYLDPKKVPSFLGGECTCEHQNGCVAGLPNDSTKPKIFTSEEIETLKQFYRDHAIEREENYKKFLEKIQKEEKETNQHTNN